MRSDEIILDQMKSAEISLIFRGYATFTHDAWSLTTDMYHRDVYIEETIRSDGCSVISRVIITDGKAPSRS